jgi:hypothetical protein
VSFPFAAPLTAGNYVPSSFSADLNGDGYDDLILGWLGCCAVVPNVQVVMNQRDGTFGAPVDLQDSATLWDLIPGDANGDGITDLFSAGYGDAGVRLRIGSGDGRFQPPRDIDTGFPGRPAQIGVASLRGNGVLDVVAFFHEGPEGASELGVMLGDGKGHFSMPATYGASTTGWDGFQVVNFDGDGFPDVIVYDTLPAAWSDNHARIGVLHGNGDGTLGGIEEVVLDPPAVQAWAGSAQLQGAGRSDLIGGSWYASDGGPGFGQINVYWRLGDGGLSSPSPVGPPTPQIASFLVSDLNGDGTEDILSVSGLFNPTMAQIYINACGAPSK